MAASRRPQVQYTSVIENYELPDTRLIMPKEDRYQTHMSRRKPYKTMFDKIIADNARPERCSPAPNKYDVN